MMLRRLVIAALLVAALGAGVCARAGTGFGDSGPAVVDTAPPVVTVEDPAAHTVLQTGQQISLGYSLADDHPGTDAGDNRTEVWFGDLLWEAGPDVPGDQAGTWSWTAPDTTSGTVHLVVTATDAFGNRTTVASGDFTILSGVTDVPGGVRSGVVFRRPAPNPFNPRTQLRFELPEAGPVQVAVFDARGRLVRTLAAGVRPQGPLDLAWDGTDDAGRRQAAGLYLFRLDYRLDGADRVAVRKATLLP
ncbi:hypothetical protein KDM41_12080 [bacterium]|nr:hypothetical protein [bacterium]